MTVVACLLVFGQQPKFLGFPIRFRLQLLVDGLCLLLFFGGIRVVALLIDIRLRSDVEPLFAFLLLSLVDLVLFLSLAVEDFLLDSLGFLFD